MAYSRILIVRMSALGDVIMTLPCLSALRKAYPLAHISWLVNKDTVPLLEGNPLLNQVIAFDRKLYNPLKNWGKFLQFAHSLKDLDCDLVIDFQGLLRSAFLSYSTQCPIRVGSAEFREWSSIFYTHWVNVKRKDYHAVDWHIELLKGTPGITLPQPIPVEFSFPDFSSATASLYSRLEQAGWQEKKAWIAMAPSARWKTKRWLPERFAELGDRLIQEYGIDMVLIGGKEDQVLGNQIESFMQTKPVNLIGKTSLVELAQLLKMAKMLIANDTGPLHLAVGLGIPVVAVFGPTNPRLTGPYFNQKEIVRVEVPCGPCRHRICPGHGHICMRNISTNDVYSVAQNILK